MRVLVSVLLLGLTAGPALAVDFATQHFDSYAEAVAQTIGGFEFFGRGDTAKLQLTRTDPFAQAQLPFSIWNDGIAHAFKVVYNAGGIAGISIDDEYTLETPVTIAPETNGLLVTAFSNGANGVLLDNLKLTLPGFVIYNLGDVAQSPAPDYMLVSTDVALRNGFILSGRVTFNWDASLPAPDEQWFEVTPVVTPEPSALLMMLALPLALRRR